uniref:L1 transposable element RRM domain-containing protein n=1 Tax=Latimeria chalumnae TaxID=7897 RepID=H3A965_LATCH
TDLKSTVQSLKNSFEELTKQTTELEQRISDIEDQSVSRDKEMSLLQQNLATEGVEKGNPVAFLRKIIPELLNLAEDIRIDVERAHRSLTPKPAPSQRPRPFIVKFLRFPIKEQILRVARIMGNLQWQGNKISVFPDFSRELQNKRQKFSIIRNILRVKNIKYGLFYPATLKIFLNNQTQTFTDPDVALEYVLSLPPQNSYLPPRAIRSLSATPERFYQNTTSR